jgi:hypothetical protein
MARLETPLLGKTLWKTGDILLRAELDLLLKDNTGGWLAESFLVDSGTEMSMMPASLARALDLPLPFHPVPGGLDLLGVTREVRTGILRARINGLGGAEFSFPCYFIGDPDSSLDRFQRPTFPRNLLGLTGVVDQIRIHFDGTPTIGFPHGSLVIETIWGESKQGRG